MVCPKCNNNIPNNSAFCNICGLQVASAIKPKRKMSNNAIGCLALFMIACFIIVVIAATSGGNKNTAIAHEEIKISEKLEKDIRTEIGIAEKFFSIRKIYIQDTGTIEIWVDLKFEPENHKEISVWLYGFINDIEKQYNYELDMAITAMSPIEGTDKNRVYGTSTFYKSAGKIEYKPMK